MQMNYEEKHTYISNSFVSCNPAGRPRHFDYSEIYPPLSEARCQKRSVYDKCPTVEPGSSYIRYSRSSRYLLGEVNSSVSRDVNASLSGEITRYLGNLSNLTHLDLEGNYNLSTQNLDWVSSLSSLKYLYMGRVKINHTKADWLHAINMLPSLRELSLYSCELNHLPSSLTSLNLASLLVLDLSYNPFNTSIDLSYNPFNTSIPQWLFNLTSLKNLDLTFSNQRGKIPDSFGRLGSLKYLYLGGPIPPNISDLMPSLQYLDLSENHLYGKIPLSISKIKHLNILVLRRNNLSGELPHQWNESQKGLRVVDISYNNICGKIPSSMGFLGNLSILVLSNNNLSGEIPSSLQNCSIVSMDFGGNRLSGNLPSWIESDIFMLRLRSNLFSGTIPRKWCNLHKLHILDLAQNNLSGGIPDCFNNFIAMVDHNTSWYEPIENYTEKANIDSIANCVESSSFEEEIWAGKKLKFVDWKDGLVLNLRIIEDESHSVFGS
ncbi:hypothetical protein CMV_023582 [Castanea mollissima]|uniref:Uncharacterized protein n=1 Tax=Castanea mollissima TaxID=60419 RepID=A0A8J4VDC5_9ROSI|nr:hypothetical protein CMV_023582 [Castanea mollissima]